MDPRTWLVTGASSGFGQAITQEALAAGERVIGTFRSVEAAARFQQSFPGRAFGVCMDVRDAAAVRAGVAAAEQLAGPIDILVNNAGYGLAVSTEEVTLEQMREQFEVNVFGLVLVTQQVLPSMRARRMGHVINFSSIGGLMAFPGLGIYNGSKFAVVGISEALRKEVEHLGIHVTVVEPGAFRTDWAGRSMVHGSRGIADYEESVGARLNGLAAYSGRQPGDPRKAALAVVALSRLEKPPLNLLLGRDALRLAGDKLGAMQAEFLSWAHLSASTDFDSDSRL